MRKDAIEILSNGDRGDSALRLLLVRVVDVINGITLKPLNCRDQITCRR